MSSTRMKTLPECMSPISWLFYALATYAPIAVLMHPTLLEFVMLPLVDFLPLPLFVWMEGRLFEKYHFPTSKPYFRKFDFSYFESLSEDKRREAFESFRAFPRYRAQWCLLLTSFKVIPAYLVAVFLWEHELSNGMQLLLIASISAVNFAFFYSAAYVESHIFLSEAVAELHRRQDWSNVFDRVEVDRFSADFDKHEQLAFARLIVFTLVLQSMAVTTHHGSTPGLIGKLVLVTGMGFILFSRIFYLGRSFLIRGLKEIFSKMDRSRDSGSREMLALHTTDTLAGFERTFNFLIKRLKESEQELAALVLQNAEKGRFKALGEISALVAHDLSAPIHVLGFCIDQLRENPDRINDPRYMEQLVRNAQRSTELITSLRARFKNSTTEKGIATVSESHGLATGLLRTQFLESDFQNFEIILNIPQPEPRVAIPRSDLIQVLDNLYRNSIENFHQIGAPKGRISIELVDQDDALVRLVISDTGSGLPRARFEKLTAFAFVADRESALSGSLGLRLIRRLVEYHGGSLKVLERPAEGFNTSFLLTLKKTQEAARGLTSETGADQIGSRESSDG
jgi:signal transduction histidine kinase